jgi:hypothetical protein
MFNYAFRKQSQFWIKRLKLSFIAIAIHLISILGMTTMCRTLVNDFSEQGEVTANIELTFWLEETVIIEPKTLHVLDMDASCKENRKLG